MSMPVSCMPSTSYREELGLRKKGGDTGDNAEEEVVERVGDEGEDWAQEVIRVLDMALIMANGIGR